MNVTLKCEHRFWNGNAGVDEPFAAASGLIMCLLPLFDSAGLTDPPLQFCLARASLVLCGLGTFCFHALSDEQMDKYHINGIIFDKVSMAVVTVCMFLLYLNEWMKRNPMVISLCAMLYLFFWIITNDLFTFRYLQSITTVNGVEVFEMAAQYTSFILVYLYILFRIRPQGWTSNWPMWTALLISLVAWVLNQFACVLVPWFFIGHTVWHIGIGYVAHYLIVLGVAETYGYTPKREGLLVKLDRSGRLDTEFHFKLFKGINISPKATA
jgi:hypothetical protein